MRIGFKYWSCTELLLRIIYSPGSVAPANTGKGGKNRRRGKNENENDKRELIFKEDGQEYAQASLHLWPHSPFLVPKPFGPDSVFLPVIIMWLAF